MRVNTGGDPGRDDYGLPPVDIEVPDDARELDRDVQAYRRELRSLRRRMLARKLYGPLTTDGMVLPLLAGCLALTLLAATLLTVFTVGHGTVGGPLAGPSAPRSGAARPGTGHTARPDTGTHSSSPAPTLVGAALLNAEVFVGNQAEPLSSLPGGRVLVLALIPPGCGQRCVHDLRELTDQASQAKAGIYLVGIRGEQVGGLTLPLGLGATHATEDSANSLANSLPPRYRTAGLSAVLVRTDGLAFRVVPDRGKGFQIAQEVRALTSAHAGGSPSPGVTATASAS
jgi:hypothetical protein